MATLGDLVVNLTANTAPIQKGLDKSRRMIGGFASFAGKALKAGMIAGAAGAAAGLVVIKKQFAELDQIAKDSARIGIGSKSLMQLGFAAEQSGSDVATLNTALFRMQRRVANFTTGTGPAKRALTDLGFATDSFAGLDTEQQMFKIVDALQGIQNPALRAQYAFEIFGQQAKSLLPLLNSGTDGMRAMMEEADRLGIGIDNEELAKVEAANDAMNRIARASESVFQMLAVKAAPAVETIATAFLDVLPFVETTFNAISDGFAFVQTAIGKTITVGMVLVDNWRDLFSGLAQDIPTILGATFRWIFDNTVKVIGNLLEVARAAPSILENTGKNIGEWIAFQIGASDEMLTFDPLANLRQMDSLTWFKMPELSRETTNVLEQVQSALADFDAITAERLAVGTPGIIGSPKGGLGAELPSVIQENIESAAKASLGFMSRGSEQAMKVILGASRDRQLETLKKQLKQQEAIEAAITNIPATVVAIQGAV